MKKVAVFVVSILIGSLSYSQAENSTQDKRLKFGFNLGTNYSLLRHDGAYPTNATPSSGLGFQLGVFADFRLNSYLAIAPKAELSFNNADVDFTLSDGSVSNYEVLPTTINFMSHFVFRNNSKSFSPYCYIGPNIKIPLEKKSGSTTSYPSGTDFAIDFGLGLDKTFDSFNFAPELRYSFGLLDVNKNPALNSLTFHSVALIFNFYG